MDSASGWKTGPVKVKVPAGIDGLEITVTMRSWLDDRQDKVARIRQGMRAVSLYKMSCAWEGLQNKP